MNRICVASSIRRARATSRDDDRPTHPSGKFVKRGGRLRRQSIERASCLPDVAAGIPRPVRLGTAAIVDFNTRGKRHVVHRREAPIRECHVVEQFHPARQPTTEMVLHSNPKWHPEQRVDVPVVIGIAYVKLPKAKTRQ